VTATLSGLTADVLHIWRFRILIGPVGIGQEFWQLLYARARQKTQQEDR